MKSKIKDRNDYYLPKEIRICVLEKSWSIISDSVFFSVGPFDFMNLFFSGNVFNIVVRRKCETGQMCKAVVVVDKTLSLILVKLLRHLVSAKRLAAHKEEERNSL